MYDALIVAKRGIMSNTLPTVLIIDDDSVILNLYHRELGQDFDVITCSTKDDALEVIHNQDLDAIVLEPIAMNGQGWDLLNMITLLPINTHSFPIILCSLQDERRYGLEMGATVFLVKPILPVQLMETLHSVVGKTGVIE
jgi:DNA-binding response OmpR family regulator